MRPPVAALLTLFAFLPAVAALGEPDYATGLQAALDGSGGVLLTWDPTEGATYEILRDGMLVGAVTEPSFLDSSPLPQAVYAVAVVDASTRVAMVGDRLGGDGSGDSCAPTGVGVVDTPPFVLVVLHQQCLPPVLNLPSDGFLTQVRGPAQVHSPILDGDNPLFETRW